MSLERDVGRLEGQIKGFTEAMAGKASTDSLEGVRGYVKGLVSDTHRVEGKVDVLTKDVGKLLEAVNEHKHDNEHSHSGVNHRNGWRQRAAPVAIPTTTSGIVVAVFLALQQILGF